ncbi:hypothetical protein STAN_7069 [Streptomyces sp. CBMAI 2042]|uniref:hypothetical protein n=1 Tax=Streptomyces sp. CBMAI 2042 TaxID=2305222 RepID=UPI000F21020B|nr:hypothetical protein [Streptomyces sp. CBMAI 2042]RLV64249.1 hypothetical protein STAN_7069 [Streptomyces sp. CBMAI 2042]
MTTEALPTRLSATGTCPRCEGNVETCRCGVRPGLPHHRSGLALVAEGGWGGMEDDDNRRGYERDETDTSYHELVGRLAADGDRRAAIAGRRARRTFAEMAPGQTRQRVLRMTRQLTFAPRAADDACGLCGWWRCRCGGAAPAPTPSSRAVAS